jgi:hypothetical protein
MGKKMETVRLLMKRDGMLKEQAEEFLSYNEFRRQGGGKKGANVADTKQSLTEDEQQALLAFFQDFQHGFIVDLSEFHERLIAAPGISIDLIREYTRIYKTIKMGWEHTANELQGDEGHRARI